MNVAMAAPSNANSRRAIVLGGGGVVGIAWETGVLKGLRDAGLDPAAVDLVIGTSAGATVGAQLASGRPLGELFAAQLTPDDGGTARLLAEADPSAATEIFALHAARGTLDPAVRAEVGAMALKAKTAPEAQRLAFVAARLGVTDWPATPLLITAVDAQDGAAKTFDRSSGASLSQAVAASGAVAGLFPPVTIAGRRYIDGGYRSGTWADLAEGCDLVLIVTPVGETAEGVFALLYRQLEHEVDGLRRLGATAHVIQPDAAALAAFGPNMMDPTRRAAGAREGVRQGRAAAEELRPHWRTR
jgi:NTE family protein